MSDAIIFDRVDIVFGDNPAKALAMLDAGKTRAEINEATGLVLGVANASLAVKEGEILVLMGLSGSGKSTLLRAVNQLAPVVRGSVSVKTPEGYIDPYQTSKKSLRDLRMHTVSMVFQQFGLLPWRNVADNVGFGLELAGLPEGQRKKRVAEQLELVNLSDWADRKVDGYVKRTEQRPLVSGKISSKEALVFFALLMGVSFLLVLCTNAATVWLSFGGLALAFTYPFMKRYTYYPQVVLGAAFSWGMPMAFTAETCELPAAAWLLWIANLLWTVGYDTYYAMTDRDDDLKIGVKSTAILFGEADRVIILTLQGLALGCLLLAGSKFELGGWFHLGLLAAAGCFAWEFWYTRSKDRMRCFQAFLHNHWAGLAIFVGIVLDYALR